VASSNPSRATVAITRLPSGTTVWQGTVAPGARQTLRLPGAHYRACAHQDPSGEWDGFDDCAELAFTIHPRLRLTVKPRARATVTVRAGAMLVGARLKLTAAAGGRHTHRTLTLKRTVTRVTLRLPRAHGRRVRISAVATPPAGELRIATARAARTVR